jgi:cytochrome d ubiquinol oxidase subunit II
MTTADLTMALVLAAVTGYSLLGGADFGGGFWDPLAGARTDDLAPARRRLIEHALGPVWEANHVWLIFAIVLLWTGFPGVFASVASTAYVPLTAAALGIIGRGSAFAFRKVGLERHRRWYGAVFAFSSVVTPFFFGAIVGGIASGRIPEGIAEGDRWRSWWNPTSIAIGLLAIAMCAYLAAMFLLGDAVREDPSLLPGLRARALAAAAGFGALAATGLLVVRWDAPDLSRELWRPPAAGFIGMALVTGVVAAGLVAARRFMLARISAGATAACVIWGWGAAQYPEALPGLTLDEAAAEPAVLKALLVSTVIGMLLLLPSLLWLFLVAQRPAH